MYRDLVTGIYFFASMIAGAFAGLICLTPKFGHGQPGDTYDAVRSIIIGTILGGAAWKLWQAWKMRQQRPGNPV